VSCAFLALVVASAIMPQLFATHDPNAQDIANRFASWDASHWLGTDSLGRDYYSRVVFGSRSVVTAAVLATSIAVALGVSLGTVAAYLGGRLEVVLDWVNNVLMSIPALILAITIIAALGPGLIIAMTGVGIATAPRFYRLARAATHNIKGDTFIEASRAIGCSPWRILYRHVLPNISSPIIIQAALTVGAVVLAEASLSFLGLGVQPPAASWGLMLQEAATATFQAPQLIWGPGVMLTLTVLATQFAADGLRERLGSSYGTAGSA
jgi:ABC-type dipeptide/oligopeptide/nickel transport system permease subunit